MRRKRGFQVSGRAGCSRAARPSKEPYSMSRCPGKSHRCMTEPSGRFSPSVLLPLGFWSVGFEFVIRPHLYGRFGLPLHRLAATGSSVNVMTGKQLECVPFWRTEDCGCGARVSCEPKHSGDVAHVFHNPQRHVVSKGRAGANLTRS